MVEACLRQSPEQAAGWLRRKARLSISHETIYRHIWRDRKRGGRLYLHCAVRPSNAENGTDPMIPEVGWPANGRYLSAQLSRVGRCGSDKHWIVRRT